MMELGVYTRYWGLSQRPFVNVPDLSFAFMAGAFREGLARLRYAIFEDKSLALVVGDIGVGKTFLLKLFQAECTDKGFVCPMMVNPNLSPLELLYGLYHGIFRSQPPSADDAALSTSKSRLLRQLVRFAELRVGSGSRVVFIIDEAQAISDPQTIEEIRLLLNPAARTRPLFQVVLAGQPSLVEGIGGYPGLCQRVDVSYNLPALTRSETRDYVAYRLGVSGAGERAGMLFSSDAIGQVYTYSRGLPRLINNICDMSMLVASGDDKQVVDGECVLKAAEDRQLAGSFGNGQVRRETWSETPPVMNVFDEEIPDFGPL